MHWSHTLPATKIWLFGMIVVVLTTSVFFIYRTDDVNAGLIQSVDKTVFRVSWKPTTRLPNKVKNISYNKTFQNVSVVTKIDGIHIAVVTCGNRLEESLVLLKSAVIFSRTTVVFHIFTEDEKRPLILKEIESWPLFERRRLHVNIYKIQFPETPYCPECKPEEWKNLFRPCAAQRIFIPDILKDVDSLIYMDTDTVFLSPLENVWANFHKFDHYQMFGISPELDDWYWNRKLPYCTYTGVNSGVLLMNLTKIREVKWMVKISEYFTVYRKQLELGDQDLINIYCHFQPGQFYILQCPWNYRGIFCPAGQSCPQGETEGAYILHGNSMMFHIDKMPAIRAVYESIREHNLASHSLQDLHDRMTTRITQFSSTPCGKMPQAFTTHLQKYIQDTKSKNIPAKAPT